MKSYDLLGWFSLPRAVFLGAMSGVLFLFPDFLLSKACYSILLGYTMLGGVLRVVEFSQWKGGKPPVVYGGLAVGVLLLVFSVPLIAYARYFVYVTPVLLGGLLLLAAAVYFIAACRADTALQRGILVPLALAALLGSLAVFVFTFGFGMGGLTGLAQVSGGTLLVSCGFELVCGLMRHHQLVRHAEGEA